MAEIYSGLSFGLGKALDFSEEQDVGLQLSAGSGIGERWAYCVQALAASDAHFRKVALSPASNLREGRARDKVDEGVHEEVKYRTGDFK